MVNSTILQQVFVVEFVVQNQMCDACHRQAAQDYWKAVVQVRQKVQNLSIIYLCQHEKNLIAVIMVDWETGFCFQIVLSGFQISFQGMVSIENFYRSISTAHTKSF